MSASARSSDISNRHVLVMTAALSLSYLSVAVSLPVVPVHVVNGLGMSNAFGGLAVGAAFISTIFTRSYAGALSDRLGGKVCMLRGLGCYALASLICLASAWPALPAPAAYAILIAGRLLLGVGESQVVTGMVSWGIGLAGPARSGKVMALVGMGMYGAFVIGSPAGLFLLQRVGFEGPMIACTVLPLVGWLMVRGKPASTPHPGKRESFWRVLGRIWRLGTVLGLQGVGAAVLGAFVSLYFLSRGWEHAGLGLSCFGAGFAIMRLLCGNLPDRIGGTSVAIASLTIEAVGQYLLWLSPGPWPALLGALLTGIGCSMVYPAMGTEVIKRVPPQLRGTAVGGFAAFQDVAYGVTGPAVGALADHAGYGIVFLVGGIAASLGLWLSVLVHRETGRTQAT